MLIYLYDLNKTKFATAPTTRLMKPEIVVFKEEQKDRMFKRQENTNLYFEVEPYYLYLGKK